MRTVREQDAPPEVRAIYDDLRQTLGLPHVNVVFQVYANSPTFLQLQWKMLRPVVESQQFFDAAERLRADAYTRIHNYFDIPDFCGELDSLRFTSGAKQEVTEVIELFDYNDALLLLLIATQQQAFDGPVGDASAKPKPVTSHPVFDKAPILVEDEGASHEVSRVYDQMKHAFNIPVVITDFRAFARWPDFLRKYWQTLHPLLENPLYQQCQYAIRESAWSLVRELPMSVELTPSQLIDAGMDEEDIGSLVRITQAFARGVSGSVLNVAVARIGIEGGNRMALQPPGRVERAHTPTRAA